MRLETEMSRPSYNRAVRAAEGIRHLFVQLSIYLSITCAVPDYNHAEVCYLTTSLAAGCSFLIASKWLGL